jgi:glycosyltransferase involved in cell wall biosynthesis
MSLLSIVIPVYRVEKTLDRCLQSIASQSFADWEATLVDDGSTDNSPALCDAWALRDPRFKVLHKPNGGLSDARNAGIEVATGTYITFVDSDDYLAADTLRPLMTLLAEHPDTDMLEYVIAKTYATGEQEMLQFEEQVYTSFSSYWMGSRAYQHSYAWNKIYRRELWADVRFPKGRVFEDIYTLPLLLEKAQCIRTTALGAYHYCDNPQGISHCASGSEWNMLLEAHLRIYQQLQSKGDEPDDHYYLQMLNIQLYTYCLTGKAPQLPQRHLNWLQSNLVDFLKASALNLLGIKKLCKLYRTICQTRIHP